jgi:hypothetical protein
MLINKTMHDQVNQKRKKYALQHWKKKQHKRPVLDRPFK